MTDHPSLAGPGWRATLTATLTANLVRNVGSHSMIVCGHLPEGVETFEQESRSPDESRVEWYLRQMLGSADISGPRCCTCWPATSRTRQDDAARRRPEPPAIPGRLGR